MIYLDNGATTLRKPECVKEALLEAMASMGNSGRGVHDASLYAGRIIYRVRESLAELLGAAAPEQVVFTANGTESLNLVLGGLFGPGDHVITTVLEHNSVLRPLYMEQERGVELSIIGADEQADVLYEKLESAIKCNTKAVICTHGSNVTGNLVDIKRIGAVCREHQLLFILDSSQSAGCIPISMKENQIDILCFTGHKGLMGPQGTGGICIRPQISIRPLKSGGTGVLSFLKEQPQELPEHLEAGTLNGHGIAGLLAAIGWLNRTTVEVVQKKEEKLLRLFYENAKEIPKIHFYGRPPEEGVPHLPVLALNLENLDSAYVSDILAEEYEIYTRAGAHCAPLMHQALKTEKQGCVRFSFSWFNTEEEIKTAVNALKELSRG